MASDLACACVHAWGLTKDGSGQQTYVMASEILMILLETWPIRAYVTAGGIPVLLLGCRWAVGSHSENHRRLGQEGDGNAHQG